MENSFFGTVEPPINRNQAFHPILSKSVLSSVIELSPYSGVHVLEVIQKVCPLFRCPCIGGYTKSVSFIWVSMYWRLYKKCVLIQVSMYWRLYKKCVLIWVSMYWRLYKKCVLYSGVHVLEVIPIASQ